MKALIAAGGHGTRLRPITYSINKHLFPIANKPMIFYALERISEAGIKEAGININKGETEIQRLVGKGDKWGLKITYIEQEGGALGLAHVIKNAKNWIGRDELLFYLGDNIISTSIKGLMDKFRRDKLDCLLALSRVSDPERFGVPIIKGKRIIRVEEKPKSPQSDFAVTGIYVYSNKIIQAVGKIKPSARGELEISDAHTYLIEHGAKVGYEEITGWWKDTGKPKDLLEGNALVLAGIEQSRIRGLVGRDVEIQGTAVIGEGTKISQGVVIKGPVIIGANCRIEKAIIGPNVSVARDCEVKETNLKNTIICQGSRVIGCKKGIARSLIGRDCLITAEDSTKPRGHRLIIGDKAEVEL
ncbi:MAG: glucose-1-phosphate thymidylyltransferase [Patescibacteria group bacterium]|nr:glucose-1-phosphate thymidylyltransferase [Patescibacteria group bacterium]